MIKRYVERLYFAPRGVDALFIALLLPLSLLYALVMAIRRKAARRQSYRVPIVSVGNLVIGGSGKTPFTIALASRYENIAVVLRGYGRKSKGLQVVSHDGKVMCDVACAGDEAILLARSLPDATVIVSEDRKQGIEKAIALGVRAIFLDDGFNRVEIEKYEIVLEPEMVRNPFVLPAGPWREWRTLALKEADLSLKEGREYKRKVMLPKSGYRRFLLVSAIARPERLMGYLEGVEIADRYFLPDHHYFDESTLRNRLESSGAEAILTTAKDRVKMEGFKLPIVEMKLQLEIDNAVLKAVDRYIEGKNDA